MKKNVLTLGAMISLALAGPAAAQVSQIDPNDAAKYGSSPTAPQPPATTNEYQPIAPQQQAPAETSQGPATPATAPAAPGTPAQGLTRPKDTMAHDDVLNAAEGVFGKGAEGLAGIVEKILKDQGKPSAYIAGHEAGGAFVVGVRYGSGVMRHEAEGDRPVYWTGPSVGFDAGADANKVFVLVYNLNDTEKLFRRYPAAEGHAYAVGGFTASYLRRGDIVLIPIRLGVGLRLGANVGYMKFTQKANWVPF